MSGLDENVTPKTKAKKTFWFFCFVAGLLAGWL